MLTKSKNCLLVTQVVICNFILLSCNICAILNEIEPLGSRICEMIMFTELGYLNFVFRKVEYGSGKTLQKYAPKHHEG